MTAWTPTAEDIHGAAAAAGLRPDPLLTISQWADQYRTLSQRASAEPGPWRTDRTPYLREIMDCLSPASPFERAVFMKGAQIGGTECGNNWIGYVIHQAPGPMMAVQPTVEMAKRNSKQRIDPLIEESKVLRSLVSDPRSRDSSNTVLSKDFPGGVLVMTGANSAVGLRSMAARYLFLDEVDAYPGDVEGEGDPINLAMARTRTFARRKVFLCSTPKITGMSRIEAAFDESDKRRFWVPCPVCREFQILKFAQLRWPKGQPEKAVYACEHCGQDIANHQKQWMLPRGEWRANPGPDWDRKTAGFHLSSLYSPVGWFSWGDAATQFERAQKNASLLQVFVNTVLGETWMQMGDAPDWQRLYDRREKYRLRTVPEGGLFLTAGVDVQRDRIEAQIVAWGRGKESWLVDYVVLDGDTARAEVWRQLTDLLGTTYPHANGAQLGLVRMAVDSGWATQEVYHWARQQGPGRVIVVKGYDRGAAAVGQPSAVEVTVHGKKISRGVKVWPVATGMLKSELYGWLKLERPTEESGDPFPPGYCHVPQMPEEFFRQLTAEQLVPKIVKGYRRLEWVKTRERNEALDCFDAETEVLTRRGWKHFQHVSPEDLLATVNLDTDEIEYQLPTHLIAQPYRGPMVKIHGRRIDILVTPNHRMVTYRKEYDSSIRKWRFEVPPKITRAEDLTIHHQLKLTGTWKGTDRLRVQVPASFKDRDGSEIEPRRFVDAGDMAEFLGWYVAEGGRFTGISRTQGNRRHRVEISQNVGAKFDCIEGLLDRLPWKWHIAASTNKPGRKFVCASKQLHRYLDECGGKQDTRRVPQWVKDSPPDVIRRFLDAAVGGDGWMQGAARTIATISRQLADDYQELFIKSGCAANIRTVHPAPYCIDGRLGFNVRVQYHVSECRRKKASLDGGGQGRRQYIGRKVQYDGSVYCATVPNGTLICRRKGRSFVAGNCRVYARAAAAQYGIDRFNERHWKALEEQIQAAGVAIREATERVAPSDEQKQSPKARVRRVVRSRFLER